MTECLPIPTGGFDRREESGLFGSLWRALPRPGRKPKALATLEAVELRPHARPHRAEVRRRSAAADGPVSLMQTVIWKYLEHVPAVYHAEDDFSPRPVDVLK